MNFDVLTEENYVLYASKVYHNPHCESLEEFYDDLKRINYVKKLLNKYVKNEDLKERLVLNHLILLHNVFGVGPTARMLFFRLEEELYPALKTFLVYLRGLPERVDGKLTNAIPLDANLINILRNI